MNRNILMSSKRLASSMALVLLAVGVFGSQQALAQVSTTKHNLGSSAGGLISMRYSGTGEICVFCHTPHGGSTSAAVPLWNRTLAAPTAYTTYNSLGTTSLEGATAAVGSVSIACLSCHDGTTSMNVMINTPGSGSAAGGTLAGTWSGTALTVGATGLITSPWSNLTQDLRNDHPVGHQYGGGPIAGTVPAPTATVGTYVNTLYRDPAFRSASSQLLNGVGVWWVDPITGGTTARERSDVQLYTRTAAVQLGTGTVLTGAQPFVECGSCHDPHSSTALFVRVANTGSALCLTCHIK